MLDDDSVTARREDGFILKDGVRYVFLHKDNTRPMRNLRVAFGDSPLGPWGNISRPFTENFTERPCALKISPDWLIYYDAYRAGVYGAVKTRDFATFTDITRNLRLRLAAHHRRRPLHRRRMSTNPAPQPPNPAAFTAPAPAPVQMPLKICIQPTAGEVITSLRTGVSCTIGDKLGEGHFGSLEIPYAWDRN